MTAYRFKDGEFQEFSSPFGDATGDWEEILKTAGWRKLVCWPAHQYNEFAEIEASIYRYDAGGEAHWKYMADIYLQSEGIGEFYCFTAPDLLRFIRDWLMPLLAGDDRMLAMQTLISAGEKLLDGQTGLACAQRFEAREAERYYRRKEREKAKVKAG